MKLKLVSNDPAGITRIAAEGTITASDFRDDQHNPLADFLGADWARRRVLLDIDKVNYIDSRSIGWLIATHKAFRSAGGRLVVHSPTLAVRQILDMLKVGRVIHIADSEAAAGVLVQGDSR